MSSSKPEDKPLRSISWEAWIDEVYQVMLNDYPQIFGSTGSQPQLPRGEVDWEQWRPWYTQGLSAREAVAKSLITD